LSTVAALSSASSSAHHARRLESGLFVVLPDSGKQRKKELKIQSAIFGQNQRSALKATKSNAGFRQNRPSLHLLFGAARRRK